MPGLAIGLGGSVLCGSHTSADPWAMTDAVVTTTLVVAAMGVRGLTLSKDLATTCMLRRQPIRRASHPTLGGDPWVGAHTRSGAALIEPIRWSPTDR